MVRSQFRMVSVTSSVTTSGHNRTGIVLIGIGTAGQIDPCCGSSPEKFWRCFFNCLPDVLRFVPYIAPKIRVRSRTVKCAPGIRTARRFAIRNPFFPMSNGYWLVVIVMILLLLPQQAARGRELIDYRTESIRDHGRAAG